MATNINVDLDQLQDTWKVYKSEVTNLKACMRKLDSAIGDLKSADWISDAATAYFNNYDTAWKENMQRQTDILEHLRDCLETADSEYQNIYDAVGRLGSRL